MNDSGYEAAFHRYEHARENYARLQEDIHQFLARFTGNPELREDPFVIQDMARMEGLRFQRDQLYAEYIGLERAIFGRLGKPWSDPKDSV